MGSQDKGRGLVAATTIFKWLFMDHKAVLFNLVGKGECCNALLDMHDSSLTILSVTHLVRHNYVIVIWNWVLCSVCYIWFEDSVFSECLWFHLSMSWLPAPDFRLNVNMVDICHDMVHICPHCIVSS
jgi:hypothetical protein